MFTIGSVTVTGDLVTVTDENITHTFNALTGEITKD